MLGFWQSLRGKVVHPKTKASFVASIVDNDEDAFEDATEAPPSWHGQLMTISGLPLIITYLDGKGQQSTRLITCQRLDEAANILYLWAYCHNREKVRQFRIDRISELADGATGELLNGPADYFRQFQIDRSQRSKPGWGLSVRQRAEFTAVLNTLVFMARCDKHFHPLERTSLEACVTRYWLRFECRGDPDTDAILRHADHLAPDAETFFVSLMRCAGERRLAQLVKQCSAEIIDADGVHAEHEIYWGRKIDEFFARN
ncbi:MAG: WYL domain-containing protein [Sphingomonadaceae bacterium]